MHKNPLTKADVGPEEVPVPRCGRGSVLLGNRFSLISAGTESASVKRNVKDMVVKAMTDPELRDSVKDMLLKDGVRKTADRVHYETTKWTPLGYSGAGIAVEVGEDIEGITVGDRVAYGGEGHAEFIRAAKHLCVKVPDGVELEEAAFVAVGSIALQAVRRSEVQVGDVVAVLGLGLVGQLVAQMLQAAGARVVGSDVVRQRIELAQSLGLEKGFLADEKLPSHIRRYTDEIGVDRVVICASTSSSQVIEQAVAMARDRGRIVVVGMINLDVPCEDFYRKELDLVISRSYGPGRYDPQYEEHGIDYPVGYIRWTENRNMQEFLRLIAVKKVKVKPLISHQFPLDSAGEAFQTLTEHREDTLAILLQYDGTDESHTRDLPVAHRSTQSLLERRSGAAVAVVGCGGFARQFHLPNIKQSPDLNLHTLVASSGQSAKEMAVRYGAAHCTTDFEQMVAKPDIDAVMIFTRDNTHARLTAESLRSGKHVFCEKPLATSEEECGLVADAARDSDRFCMVGFNRRFAPLVQSARHVLADGSGPTLIQYRVNAGPLPADHWTFDPKYAAGRIIGEVCHFVDLAYWLIGSEPIEVAARAVGDCPSMTRLEDVTATFRFADGSVANILYTAAGSSDFPKERFEIFRDGTTIAMDDFNRLTVRGRTRIEERNRRGDKGHDAEMAHFSRVLLGREPLLVDHRDGIRATVCCLNIFESARQGVPMPIVSDLWDR